MIEDAWNYKDDTANIKRLKVPYDKTISFQYSTSEHTTT